MTIETTLRPLAADAAPSVPNVTLRAELGRGGFGVVYAGQHLALDVPVAVKLVTPPAGDPLAVRDALREAQLLARLDHPNLVRIYDAGLAQGRVYLVLELMDGGSMEGRHQLGADVLARLARQLLAGLQALHDSGLIHRDIKPANCLARSGDDRVKLADLGVAQRAATAEVNLAGTLPYMAPELFQAAPRFSPQTDLYALGLTLATLALPQAPMPPGGLGPLLAWALGRKGSLVAQRPDLPSGLSGLIDWLAQPRPEDRPPSATAALAALDGQAISLRQVDPAAPRLGPWALGARIYQSGNWTIHAASHVQTGAPARLVRPQPGSPVARMGDALLESASTAALLEHPGFLPVLDWGCDGEQRWVVTASLNKGLDDLLREGARLDEPTALSHALDLVDALASLHAAGWVYQMVEPGAVAVRQDGQGVQLSWPWYLVRSGTASTPVDGRSRRIYSVPHFAPEVLSGGPIEPSVDVYGLGEALFFMLSGQRCFEGGDTPAVLFRKLDGPERLPERLPLVTQPTRELIAALLAAQPDQRPPLAQVAQTLRRIRGRLIAR